MHLRFWSPVLAGGLLVLLGCWGGSGRGGHAPVPSPPKLREPVGTLTGRLTDRDSGGPLAQVAVLAQRADEPFLIERTVTNLDGTYRLVRLPLGVPIRVVGQPVHGVIAYAAGGSEPVTLAEDVPAEPVDLAFAPVALTGTVEGAPFRAARPPRPDPPGPGRRPGQGRRHGRGARHGGNGHVALVLKRDAGGGRFERILVRVVQPAPDGSFRFSSVPPGAYEVHYRARMAGARRHGHPRWGPRVVAIQVEAGLTAHVTRPARVLTGAQALALEGVADEAEEARRDQAEERALGGDPGGR